MLTESVADPRRANWLTISSMSEDLLCWPEESGPSSSVRPSWELEAEILRLTTRLMMRETELKQVKSQLKSQTKETQQQMAQWRRKMEEKDGQLQILLLDKDSETQAITSQLLLFEAELRQEQKRIESLLREKDKKIEEQTIEIHRLRKELLKETSNKTNPTKTTSDTDTNAETCPNDALSTDPVKNVLAKDTNTDLESISRKPKDSSVRVRAIQDLTNVRTRTEKTFIPEIRCENNPSSEKRRIPHKTPQKMKDLKAKRINTHRVHHHRPMVNEVICGQVIL